MNPPESEADYVEFESSRKLGLGPERKTSWGVWKLFLGWTAFWWLGVFVCGALFFAGKMDFVTSTKTGLYGMSVWLNGWLLVPLLPSRMRGTGFALYHECLVVWMLSYVMTNILWEIPWVTFSRIVFEDVHTLDDVLKHVDYMRENVLHMYWWILASFSSVDLRTVNHDPTFFTLELYSFINVISTIWFFRLNKQRSPYRYLIPVLGCGEPVASTFIFSFTEVVNGFGNMTGGVADTLLALVWTQYQYIVFPMAFGYYGTLLLLEDWRVTGHSIQDMLPPATKPSAGDKCA